MALGYSRSYWSLLEMIASIRLKGEETKPSHHLILTFFKLQSIAQRDCCN